MVISVKKFQQKKRYKILIVIILVLVIFRLLLPYILLHYANKTLANVPGYYGHVQDIDVSLYRGAYQIDSIYLDKMDSLTHKQTDFFAQKTLISPLSGRRCLRVRLWVNWNSTRLN